MGARDPMAPLAPRGTFPRCYEIYEQLERAAFYLFLVPVPVVITLMWVRVHAPALFGLTGRMRDFCWCRWCCCLLLAACVAATAATCRQLIALLVVALITNQLLLLLLLCWPSLAISISISLFLLPARIAGDDVALASMRVCMCVFWEQPTTSTYEFLPLELDSKSESVCVCV